MNKIKSLLEFQKFASNERVDKLIEENNCKYNEILSKNSPSIILDKNEISGQEDPMLEEELDAVAGGMIQQEKPETDWNET